MTTTTSRPAIHVRVPDPSDQRRQVRIARFIAMNTKHGLHKMRAAGLALGFGLLLFSVVSGRLIWEARPETMTAVQFWVATLMLDGVFLAMDWSRPNLRYGWLMVLLGASSNALVTLANGGRMPVLGEAPSRGGASVWVAATDDHVLLWLCDRFWGFSIGDGLVLMGVLVMMVAPVVVWAVRQVRRRRPVLIVRQGGFS